MLLAASHMDLRLPNLAGPHCEHRLFEWTMAWALVLLGGMTIVFPTTISQSHFSPILDFVPGIVFSMTCFLTGLARLVAMYQNGNLPIAGPVIRSLGAVFGAVITVSIAFALLRQSWSAGRPPSPGIPFYVMLCISEFRSARRAASDVRTRI